MSSQRGMEQPTDPSISDSPDQVGFVDLPLPSGQPGLEAEPGIVELTIDTTDDQSSEVMEGVGETPSSPRVFLLDTLQQSVSMASGRKQAQQEVTARHTEAGVAIPASMFNPELFKDVLSPKEIEVLQAIVDGNSTDELAAALHISDKTLKNHLYNIFPKLGARNRTEAVIRALQIGVVRMPESPKGH